MKDMFDPTDSLNVRLALEEDLPAIAKFAVQLARQHADYDGQRFDLSIFEPIEASHLNFISEQYQNERAAIFVAEKDGRIVGYAFLRIEPKYLGDLSDEGVWLHDIYFDESARGCGIAATLFARVVEEAKKLGSGYLMLTVSPQNTRAQKFFKKMGLRSTMQEMRLDFSADEKDTVSSIH